MNIYTYINISIHTHKYIYLYAYICIYVCIYIPEPALSVEPLEELLEE
jgi:hypothetical protein